MTGFLVGGGAVPPEPLNNHLYANGLSLQHVVTEGNFQVMDGVPRVDDSGRMQQRGGEVHSQLWVQLDSEGWLGDPSGFSPTWPFSLAPAPADRS